MSQNYDPALDTDTITALDVAPKDEIVVTSALGRLRLSRTGLAIEGPPAALDAFHLKAPSFNGYPLKLELNGDQLILIARHGENWGYQHPLGSIAPDLQKDPRLNRLILIANTRLSLWLDPRS